MSVRARRTSAGFTLIEMLIVLAIIMVLAGLVLAALSSLSQGVKERAARADMTRIKASIEQYKVLYHKLPDNGAGLTNMSAADIVRMLIYDSDTNRLPRGTILQNVKRRNLDENGFYIDPWLIPYHISIDEDADEDGVWDVRQVRLRELKDAVDIYTLGDDGETDWGHNAEDGHTKEEHEAISEISEPYDDIKP